MKVNVSFIFIPGMVSYNQINAIRSILSCAGIIVKLNKCHLVNGCHPEPVEGHI